MMNQLLSLFLGCFLLSANLFADVTVTVESSEFPPDLKSFFVSFKVTNIAEQPTDTFYSKNLIIKLAGASDDALPFDAAAGGSINWFVRIYKTESAEETGVDGKKELKTTIEFKSSGDEIKELLKAKSNKLTLNVAYEGGGSDQAVAKDFSVERETVLAKEAPSGVSMTGANKSVIGRWSKKDTIKYSSGDDKAGAGVSMYLAQVGTPTIELDGFIFDGKDEVEDAESTCTFVTNSPDDSVCITCTDDSENVYIDTSTLPDTVKYRSTSSDADKAIISDLEEKDSNGKLIEYIAFLVYNPSGLIRSKCYRASVKNNVTLSEKLGESDANKENPNCFIATAAYGTATHEKLDLLRWFRNEYLLSSPWGHSLVMAYYQYSPPVAAFIADKPMLRASVRVALYVPLVVLEWFAPSNNVAE